MALTTVNITGTFNFPDATWSQYTKAEFHLSGYDTDTEVVVPKVTTVALGALGELNVNLWGNDDGLRGTVYRVNVVVYEDSGYSREVLRRDLGRIQIVGNGPIDIATLLDTPPVVPMSWYSVISQAEYDAAIQAVADAEAFALQAEAFGNPEFNTISIMAAFDGFVDGQYVDVYSGLNGQSETFQYDAASTATADGALIVTATGMGVGRLISQIKDLATVDDLLTGDLRGYETYTAGDIVHADEYSYEVLASGAASAHVTTAGGVALKVLTMNVRAFGAFPGNADDAIPLQAFFDAISAADYNGATIEGDYNTSVGIIYGYTGAVRPLTRRVFGNFRITAIAPMTNIFRVNGLRGGSFDVVETLGTGGSSSSFAARTCVNGILLDDCGRTKFKRMQGSRTSFGGVTLFGGNNTLCDLGKVACADVGSGTVGFSLTGIWSAPVNAGTANSTGQSTTISVDTMPPDYIVNGDYGAVGDAPYYVRLDGEVYAIRSVNTGAGTLTVYPWVKSTATPGSFEYVFGGGLYLRGADCNIIKADSVDNFRAGICVVASALYGPLLNRVVAQSCGMALNVGRWITGACYGTEISNFYVEACSEGAVFIGAPGASFDARITTSYELDLSKFHTIAARDALDAKNAEFLSQITVNRLGIDLRPEKSGRNVTSSSTGIGPERVDQFYSQRRDTSNIVFKALDLDVNRLFGYDTVRMTFFGNGANREPTGTYTFLPPAGWTVNGVASVPFSGFTVPPSFVAFYEVATQNIIVTQTS